MNKKTTGQVFDENVTSVVAAQDLNLDVTFKRATPAMFSTWIRVLGNNWQQGTVACKDRSDVSRTNRKPWKQKGTGRARAGTARSPLWKGGGVIFGPQPRVRTLKVDKRTKSKILLTMLADCIEQKKLMCINWMMSDEKPKTSVVYNLLKHIELIDKRIVLFVDPYDFSLVESFANIPNVQLLSFDQANAYNLANSDYWLFLKKDFDYFKDMVSQWV